MDKGITRLEFSSYFYSFKQQKEEMNINIFQANIDKAFNSINQLKDINYKV